MLISIETSTKSCSVALLTGDGEVLASAYEHSDQYVHSEKLHLFIQQVLKEAKTSPTDLSAVAVGKGPGSYTGLRIGVSAAKGLCYALQIPLVSADGPAVLTAGFLQNHKPEEGSLLMPVIDARRMEVYAAHHDYRGKRIREIKAEVMDSHSFENRTDQTVYVFGDGAEKLEELYADNAHVKIIPGYQTRAEYLGLLALEKIAQGELEDTAYFEPFYLKDFKAIKPKNPFA